jgi:hypothetical protein
MPLIKDLLDKPPTLSAASKYTTMNGVVLGAGAPLLAWPGATQTLFMEPAFVGNEEGLIRMIGMAVAVIGWLNLFGGRSGSRQFVAASVVDRLVRTCGARAPGDSRRVSSFAGDVRDSRPVARHWCLEAFRSQDVMPRRSCRLEERAAIASRREGGAPSFPRSCGPC